jgi:hypothetical protein
MRHSPNARHFDADAALRSTETGQGRVREASMMAVASCREGLHMQKGYPVVAPLYLRS